MFCTRTIAPPKIVTSLWPLHSDPVSVLSARSLDSAQTKIDRWILSNSACLPLDLMQIGAHAQRGNDATKQTALLRRGTYFGHTWYDAIKTTIRMPGTPNPVSVAKNVRSSCRYVVQTWTETRTRWTITLFGFGFSIPQALPSLKKLGPPALLILSECYSLANITRKLIECLLCGWSS